MSTVKANNIEPASGGTVTITGAALTTPALGTPASGTLTNCTGLPGSTGISGTVLASNIVTAYLNAVTPSGGTLAITGATSTTGLGSNGDSTTTLYYGKLSSTATYLQGRDQAGTASRDIVFFGLTEYGRFENSAGAWRPGADNSQTNGTASYRWSVVYAGTGTINTSDQREKTPLRPLNERETACALELAKTGPGVFQWLESVKEKGADKARLHVGYTVQQVMTVMEKHGLDPTRYGFICYDQWPREEILHPATETTEEYTEVREAGDRWGFRPQQLSDWIQGTALKALIEKSGL